MPENQDKKPIEDFAAKIHKVKMETGLATAQEAQLDDGATFGAAYKVSIDIVVSLVICTGIGWGLDYIFGWTPWAMLVGLVIGAAAGINNAVRTAMKMDQAALEKMQSDANNKDAKASVGSSTGNLSD